MDLSFEIIEQLEIDRSTMKVLFVLALATLAYANVESNTQAHTFGYIKKYAIPLAEELRKIEEQAQSQATGSRIVGGSPSAVGAFPYQAGLLASYFGIDGTGICGGSLVSANRVLTAAHCWYDGQNQAFVFTVVLGSSTLFTGGTRIVTGAVAVHPNWNPSNARNDVAVIYLPHNVAFSNLISPVALPSGSQLNEDFAGETAIASGFGKTGDNINITVNQVLSHVSLSVITNSVCRFAFPLFLHSSNICTSGIGGPGTCQGDSGGPLVVNRNGQPLLVGITSFGSPLGCESVMPAAYARVTSFMDFFNQHL
ncbi:brachyurin [Spodoptera frugiperda]|uniref:Brachyurin n=1 Tax=Spodoptera frugiperda TaxID=7108 RepID=A0A9R0DNG9_SPOFR|nr:brachyurin [Spodoptera frugiperda]